MRYKALIVLALLSTTTLVAQTVYDVKPERIKPSTPVQPVETSGQQTATATPTATATTTPTTTPAPAAPKEEKTRVVTGFTGGMMLHIGYGFAQSPNELFHNGSLQQLDNLPKDGVTIGLGGTLRLHLINHIHLGAEGGMSAMPLKSNGTSIRIGWGGALCDFYSTVGKAQLFIGGVIGGGSSNRLYVPTDHEQTKGKQVIYNASYTKTPFFLLDPYVGIEFAIAKHVDMLIKVDYMLPFGKGDSGITTETVRWSNFLSPSGPRLYAGFMFGHNKRR
ncbi:MAG: hypothetical protein MJZ65_04495 [Paludibacteraceae bacterium]|nr:hypothetical protein [Paludibacteraceae bacterium]